MTLEKGDQTRPEEAEQLGAAITEKDDFDPGPIKSYLGLPTDGTGSDDTITRSRLALMLLQHGYTTREELASIGIKIEVPKRKWEEIETLTDGLAFERETQVENQKPRHLHFGVVGPLGAGKTALVKQITSTWRNSGYPIVRFREKYPDNPFLPEFYKDPSADGVAFKMEMCFLIDKVGQLEQSQRWLGRRSAVVDPAPEMDYIFALAMTEMGWMKKEESDLYTQTYMALMHEKRILKPDFYLVVNAPPSVIRDRIQKRGRPFEQRVLKECPEYVTLLSEMVDQFSRTCGNNHPAINIDSNRFNYVNSPEDASAVVQEVGNWVRYYSNRRADNSENNNPVLKIPNFL
jgi:deoxyadenosine/deoxycytidine kinase